MSRCKWWHTDRHRRNSILPDWEQDAAISSSSAGADLHSLRPVVDSTQALVHRRQYSPAHDGGLGTRYPAFMQSGDVQQDSLCCCQTSDCTASANGRSCSQHRRKISAAGDDPDLARLTSLCSCPGATVSTATCPQCISCPRRNYFDLDSTPLAPRFS